MKPFRLLYFKRNSKISKTTKIYPFSRVTNATIGAYSYIAYSCIINNCIIGKFSSIAKGVNIGLGNHPTNFISTSPLFYSIKNPLRINFISQQKFIESRTVIVGNDVWVGANAIILDGVTIGNGAIIAANSVVNKDVMPYTVVGGVPARVIKKRFSENIITSINLSKWWDMPNDFLKKDEIKDIFSKELDDKSLGIFLKLINEHNNNK